MKSILLTIKPKYCELISSGEKTLEIRKNRPKIDVPFKCYIYCTLTGKNEIPPNEFFRGKWYKKKGKVIGEFVCDNIREYQTEFYTGDIFYQAIYQYADDDRYILEPVATNEGFDKGLLKKSALSFEEIKNYIGMEDETLYGWHISNLIIYDKPRELSEFRLKCPPRSWCYVEEV